MSEFFDIAKVIGSLGDFWYSLYSNREQVEAFVASFLEVQKQIQQETDALEKSLNRHTVPVFRKLNWFPIHVLESEFLASQYPYITFDSGINFNEGYSYGHRVKTSYKVTLPDEIVSVGAVQERICDNMVSITSLVIKNHAFYIDWNPFNTATTYVRDVYNDLGEVIDREAVLWLKDIEIDKEDLYNLFGYIIGIRMESSERYKKLINGLMDTLVNGPSKNTLIRIFEALLDISVINNQNALKIYGSADTMEDVCGIQITNNLIPGEISGTYIENKPVTISCSTQDGYTRVDLPCIGNSDEINDVIFIKGKANCKKITEACEIATINKILNKPNVPDPESAEILESGGGLSTWLRSHRFR